MVKGPTSTVPPQPIGLMLSMPCDCAHIDTSKFAVTSAPVFLAIAMVSPMWSSWPWVRTMWVTPSATASTESDEGKVGFPLRNGSIRISAPGTTTRKAEWPYQVSFIVSRLVSEYEAIARHNRPEASVNNRLTAHGCRFLMFAVLLSCYQPACHAVRPSAPS